MTDHITIDDVEYTITQDGEKLILEPVKLPAEPPARATVMLHNIPYFHGFRSKDGWADPWGNRYSWRELCVRANGEVRRAVAIPLGWKTLAVPDDFEITDITHAPDDEDRRWQPLYDSRDHLVPAPVKKATKLLVTGYAHSGPSYEMTILDGGDGL